MVSRSLSLVRFQGLDKNEDQFQCQKLCTHNLLYGSKKGIILALAEHSLTLSLSFSVCIHECRLKNLSPYSHKHSVIFLVTANKEKHLLCRSQVDASLCEPLRFRVEKMIYYTFTEWRSRGYCFCSLFVQTSSQNDRNDQPNALAKSNRSGFEWAILCVFVYNACEVIYHPDFGFETRKRGCSSASKHFK